MISKKIYIELCNRGMNRRFEYGSGSELHRHHIIPIHAGGLNESTNYTYLSLREHIIAHYLLWRINKSPGDLRAIRLLKGFIPLHRNRLIGKHSFENQLGVFDPKNKNKLSDWGKKGNKIQRSLGIGIYHPETSRKGALALTGRKVMHKPGSKIFKRVKPELIEEYIKNGYVFGMPLKSTF